MKSIQPKSINITVNYDKPQAIAKAIKAAKFDLPQCSLKPKSIPLFGSGNINLEVYEVRFDRVTYNHELPQALEELGKRLGYKSGFKFADPLTAILYAAAKPDRQRHTTMLTHFNDSAGQLYCLCLDECVGKRRLLICREDPKSSHMAGYCFLAVPALPSAIQRQSAN